MNQLRSLVSTAPDELRAKLRDLSIAELTATTAAMRPGTTLGMDTATKMAMRSLGRRIRALEAEVADLDAILDPLVAVTAPMLVAHYGVGTDTAAALLVAAGDNPDRIRSEATFARLCGAAPIPATSGKTQDRHLLHRGGDRQANSALWHIALTRMSSDPRTAPTSYDAPTKASQSERSCAASSATSHESSSPTYPTNSLLDTPRSIIRCAYPGGAGLGCVHAFR